MPEPAAGSVVAAPGCVPFTRTDEGWRRHDLDSPLLWADVWTSDLVVLRHGWGGR